MECYDNCAWCFMLLLQVFCGKIPKDLYEDELILLFEKSGKIWDLRLMMDPMTSTNRGYAFITYTTREEAQQAVRDVSLFSLIIYKYFALSIEWRSSVRSTSNHFCWKKIIIAKKCFSVLWSIWTDDGET